MKQMNYLISFKSFISKCHLLTSLSSIAKLRISNQSTSTKIRANLLGVHIKGHFSFDHHIEQLCCMLCQE